MAEYQRSGPIFHLLTAVKRGCDGLFINPSKDQVSYLIERVWSLRPPGSVRLLVDSSVRHHVKNDFILRAKLTSCTYRGWLLIHTTETLTTKKLIIDGEAAGVLLPNLEEVAWIDDSSVKADLVEQARKAFEGGEVFRPGGSGFLRVLGTFQRSLGRHPRADLQRLFAIRTRDWPDSAALALLVTAKYDRPYLPLRRWAEAVSMCSSTKLSNLKQMLVNAGVLTYTSEGIAGGGYQTRLHLSNKSQPIEAIVNLSDIDWPGS